MHSDPIKTFFFVFFFKKVHLIWVLSYLITTDTDPEKAEQEDRNKGFSL